jgi:hypothetical protein
MAQAHEYWPLGALTGAPTEADASPLAGARESVPLEPPVQRRAAQA